MPFDTITLEQLFPGGEPGLSNSLESSIARPLKVLMESGKNTGKIHHIFFKDSGHVFIVGSLCYTPTGRLIFFPGTLARETIWSSKLGDLRGRGITDHMTIEPDFKSWHETIFLDGKKNNLNRLPSRVLAPVEPGLDNWFGISVASLKIFEKQFEKYLFHFPVLPKNFNEYIKRLKKAKEDSRFNIMSLKQEGLEEDEFLHFDFLIDRRKSKDKLPRNNISFAPYKSPALIEAMEKRDPFLINIHRIEIPTFPGEVTILVSKHRGKLANEILIQYITPREQ